MTPARLDAWHDRLRLGRGRQAAFLLCAFAGFAGWLLLLNSPHLGANASLHWDAEASITWGPAVGSRAELADARAHLYDALGHVPGVDPWDDPGRVTDYFWSEPGLAYHEPLTRCRYYYSYVSDLIGHAAFERGRAWFGTPTAAVVCYQLAATAMTAAGLAGLLLYAVVAAPAGRHLAGRLALVGLTFAALSSAPVMLSAARQMLQETPGFAFAAATLLAVAVAGSRRSVASAVVALFVAGALAFLTVRSRYTLGPAVGMLVPIALGAGRADKRAAEPLGSVDWRRPLILAVAFALPLAAGIAVDFHRFGPFVLPWVYDDVMVRSSRLFFHADPPYGDFLVAAFINLPLLVIPAIGTWCWIDGGRGRPLWRAYGAVVLGVLGVMLWRTAAQQVRFQGRHLFAVGDGAAMLWLLVLPRVRWRPASAALYAAVSAFFLVWNVSSTFGPQRLHALAKLPDAVTVVTRHLGAGGAADDRSLLGDLWPAYFDWADTRLVHDTLVAWPYVRRHPAATVVIDDAAATANQFMLYAKTFPAFPYRMSHGRAGSALIDAARSAGGRPVFLLTAPGRRPPAGVVDVGPPEPIDLMHVALRRVTGVAPAAVDLDAGTAASATEDGLTITRLRGTPRRFDAAHGYLPRVQQEWLTYDGDAQRVEYELSGLVPGRSYDLGLVTWDPDRLGRATAVSVEAGDGSGGGWAPLLSAAAIGPHVVPGIAPTDVTVPLPPAPASGRLKVAFANVGRAGTDVAVCEVWAFQRRP